MHTASACASSTTRASASIAIPPRSGARSGCTRSAAKINATSSGASSVFARDGPPGVLDGVDLATFRTGRLVGTVEEVREQVAVWEELGVDTIIAGVGAVPFQVGAPDDVELLAAAICRG